MKRALLFLTIVLVSIRGFSLEVEEGTIRLTLDEDSSRFLLALQSTVSPDDWVPLIFAEDPRTSGLDVREGNQVFRIGDGGEFRQVAEQTDEGVFFIWTSTTLRVSERFRFIKSVGGSAIDGVQLDIAVTNLGEQPIPVGVRLLLDTYLGERGSAHFSTPTHEQITRETELRPESGDTYVRSASDDGAASLQVMLGSNAVTVPQQAVVANWKRLAESEWDYAINEDRNFNRLPYSINDSALLLTYGEKVLARNERYEITVRMGGPADNGYLDPDQSEPMSAQDRAALMDDIATILGDIDALLEDPNATPEDVATLREKLQVLSEQVPGP